MSKYEPELHGIDKCPFCNAAASEYGGPMLHQQWSLATVPQPTEFYFVRCTNCGATGPMSQEMTDFDAEIGNTHEQQAINRWNHRGEATELAMLAGREVYQIVKEAIQAAMEKTKGQ